MHEPGGTTCYDVPSCDAKKEKDIDSNYKDAGKSRNYKVFGPNSNTYVAHQLSRVGATLPKVKDAPGYPE